jgi:hypothetical protein
MIWVMAGLLVCATIVVAGRHQRGTLFRKSG